MPPPDGAAGSAASPIAHETRDLHGSHLTLSHWRATMRWSNRLSLFVLFLLFPLAASAQDVGVISGVITDSTSQQPLPNARLTVVAGRPIGAEAMQ